MKFTCVHCGRKLEVDEALAGRPIDCPACKQSVTVPGALAKTSTPVAEDPAPCRPSPRYTPSAKKPGGGGCAKFLLLLVLLAAGAFGYAMFHYDESPREVWKRLVDQVEKYLRPAPQPSPTPAPTPAPTPESTPAPTATPAPAPAATSEPALDPLTWLIEHRESWPREVTLLKATEFPVVFDDRVAGRALVPAGTSVRLVGIDSGAITTEYGGAQKQIPVAATDLAQRAIVAVAAAEAAKKRAAERPAEPSPAPVTMATPQPGPTPATKAPARFTHPGCLSTQADLERMAAKVAADKQPWKGSWDKLVGNTDGFMKGGAGVQPKIKAGGGGGENFIRLARDCAKTYQLALRYHGSGEKKFADKAVEILNAWASSHEGWEGDTNVSLRAGIYGYQFACAAELLRDYPGWKRDDFKKFQEYMKERFYGTNHYFLTRRHGTVPGHYWANWGLANLASMMAIGVLCDDKEIFEEALDFFYNGEGTESIEQAVAFRHPNGLGQWQESGRDQGHSLMGPQLGGVICEIAWNQGIDFYGYKDNRFLSGVEYVSKYNTDHDVPFVTFPYIHGHPGKEKIWVQTSISSTGRGQQRPGWDLIYNHYVNRRGLEAPFTGDYAEMTRPEGGGFNSGGNSGGFDGLGFTTLTHSLEPIKTGAPPSALRPVVEGRQVTLSWAGTANALGYEVKRATSKAGPYTTVGTVENKELFAVDTGLEPGRTYYYVVSARPRTGGRLESAPIAVTATRQLLGKIIGTEGSSGNSGATKETAFDGYLKNYFDGESVSWVGLDLGSSASAIITEVKYCPREGSAKRMVGGRFQGAFSEDFTVGAVDLHKITKEPAEGEFTSEKINSNKVFRYVRYISPEGGHGNVAEIQFFGSKP